MTSDLVGSFEVHRLPLRQLMTIDGLDAVTPGHPDLRTRRVRRHRLTVRRAQNKDAEAIYAEIDEARARYGSGRGVGIEDRRLERTVRGLALLPVPCAFACSGPRRDRHFG